MVGYFYTVEKEARACAMRTGLHGRPGWVMNVDEQTLRRRRDVRWFLWPYRVIVSLVAALCYLQPILAGQFLSGTYSSLLAHQNTAAVIDMLLILAIPIALIITVWGRRSWWPVVFVVGLLGLTSTQNSLGFGRILTLHIPLGVAIIMAATAVAVWAWRAPPGADA
ncbi:hypothetical protein Aple_090440 [Acrocarpospora pleiomorpha]|uniref:Uncharacterized protein n=2 Tax=Acrocarpospora pleiomorpha TaxID=90975 RepID=A0A5M3XYD9_9ACTN|nr:hypothetical protein Aple_090440 [Acrocarpospora pleiomorpha]